MSLPLKNLEPFTAIWLDPEIRLPSTSSSFTNARKKLRETINFLIDFSNADKCIDYIKDEDAKNIILIIAGRLARRIIPSIHNFQQLIAIYITCRPENVMRNQEVAKQYHKVKSVSSSIDQLIEVIVRDQIDREKNENGLLLSLFNSEELLYGMSCKCLEYESELIIWTQTFLQFIIGTERQAGETDITELIKLLKERQNREKSISLANSNDSQMQSVLFEIEIPKRTTISKAFVTFTNLDNLQENTEILFMFGTIFYLSSVSYVEEDKLWMIKLILCDDRNDDIKAVLKEVAGHLQENIERLGFNGDRYNQTSYNNVYQANQSLTNVTDVDLPEIPLPSLYSSKRQGPITILESFPLTTKDENVLHITPSIDTIASMDAAFELSLDTPQNRVRWRIYILWCQTDIRNNAQSYWKFRIQLEKLHLNVRYFDTIDETVQEISRSKNELYFLITSDGLADVLISQVHNHPRVFYLYILSEFTVDKDTSNLVANYKKIRIITDNQQTIYNQIASDLNNTVESPLQHSNEIDDDSSFNQISFNVDEDFTPIAIIDSDYRPGNLFRDVSHDESVFMGFQLLIKIIYCLELTDEDKHDMIQYCRSKCANNKSE
ncbi:unnamed protein product [Rotaria sordida]|uniref:Uncharacterized protein n=1 Tax=Rotaria sordida TaxID=392033 RepID=A0A819NW62_9BILA|nr:unnamed protein product [Rotaria sordida]CAF4001133.1 unnamed protein product [Rotaria sordida]